MLAVVCVLHNSKDMASFFASGDYWQSDKASPIFVDSGSTDNCLAAFAARHPKAMAIRLEENVGFGTACNAGARAAISAGADRVLFVNPDVLVDSSWVEPMDQQIGSQKCDILVAETLMSSSGPVEGPIRLSEVSNGPGCALMISGSTFEDLGGFDERIFLYWEDTDLCWRAVLAGFRVCKMHGRAAQHLRGQSSPPASWTKEKTKNGLYVAVKLLPVASSVRVCLRLLIAALWHGAIHPRVYLRAIAEGRRQRAKFESGRRVEGGRLSGLSRTHDRRQWASRVRRLAASITLARRRA